MIYLVVNIVIYIIKWFRKTSLIKHKFAKIKHNFCKKEKLETTLSKYYFPENIWEPIVFSHSFGS